MDSQPPVAQDATGDPGEVRHTDLGSDPQAACRGRAAARQSLLDWHLPALVDNVVLAVSELVGNALQHGAPPVGLTMRHLREQVHVEVHDDNPSEPPRRPFLPDATTESGRGLAIVTAVADDLTYDQVPGDGKIVRASFRTDGA